MFCALIRLGVSQPNGCWADCYVSQVSNELRLSQLWYVFVSSPAIEKDSVSFIYLNYWLFTQWNWWKTVSKYHIDIESWTCCTLHVNLISSQNWCDKLSPVIRTNRIYVRSQPLAIELLSDNSSAVGSASRQLGGNVSRRCRVTYRTIRCGEIVPFSASRNHSCIALHDLCCMQTCLLLLFWSLPLRN